MFPMLEWAEDLLKHESDTRLSSRIGKIMKDGPKEQSTESRKRLRADILKVAIKFVNEFPDFKQLRLKVDAGDCRIVEVLHPTITEIGEPTNIVPPTPEWHVGITSKVLPKFTVVVERLVGGSLEVTRFY